MKIVNPDIERTRHYTTRSEKICSNLLKWIPAGVKLIEPFVGEGDLVNLLPNYEWEVYDIDTSINAIHRDTLKEPPNYKDKWVITNPPYLAKNKAFDKSLYNQYELDDLYKIAMKTMLEANGGILIIPTNFFTDERTVELRQEFLSRFEILEVNTYTEPIFETTTYSVSAFAFKKIPTQLLESQKLLVNIMPENTQKEFLVEQKYGYRLAGEWFNSINTEQSMFSRLVKDREPDGYITNINLIALDTRQDNIRLEYNEEHHYGIPTDRVFATLVSKYELPEESQKKIVDRFNYELNQKRNEYSNLILTNYRDYNRKRIGFDFAYKLCSKILGELE